MKPPMPLREVGRKEYMPFKIQTMESACSMLEVSVGRGQDLKSIFQSLKEANKKRRNT